MNDELPEERQVVRDSQLSAMFDGELSAAECDLLARRLAKDEALRAQWSRFSMIGAALRAERGVALHDRVAWRVQTAIAQEATYGEGDVAATGRTAALVPADALRASRAERWVRYSRPLMGAGIAASVAVMSVMWLRNQEPAETVVASNSPTESVVLTADAATPVADVRVTSPASVSASQPDRYSTPAPSSQTSIAPPARLANYVVAHSEYSGPLSRRMALLSLVGTESAEVAVGEGEAISENADGTPSTGAGDGP
jgi:sigma-E factor negative regulatory protein RseA